VLLGVARRVGRAMVRPAMSKRDKPPSSELTSAAEALEAQLRRFESLADQFRRSPLNSEKSLERASKLLRDVAEQDGLLNASVSALVAAVAKTRDRQQQEADSVNAHALHLQQRAELFKALLERYGALGQSAAELNQRMQEFATQRAQAQGEEHNAALLQSLEALQERMGQVADEARAVVEQAEAQDFADVGRQAESLRQQILSARNKLGLLRKGIGAP
jgi:chromosome segregation ATPase